MWYPVCGMVHIKEPLLLIGKGSPCGDSGFPMSLSGEGGGGGGAGRILLEFQGLKDNTRTR